MKKLIFVFLCILLAITTYASTNNVCEFEYSDLGVTIIFDENSNLTHAEREYIANYLVFGESANDNVSTYAWCWLTGHDLTSEAVEEIQHKVADNIPRCLSTIYEVITCSKCDHVETNSLGSAYIDCCPED